MRLIFPTLILCLLLSGCPQRPGGPLENTLPALTTDDEEAEIAFRAAEQADEAGNARLAEEGYRNFLSEYADDPLAPLAQLGLGRVLLANGDSANALPYFERAAGSQDDAIRERARLFQGVALHLLHRNEESLVLLLPILDRTTAPQDTLLVLRTITAAALQLERPVTALDSLDRLASDQSLNELERDDARTRIRDVVRSASTTALDRAYQTLQRDGNAWPEVAIRAMRNAFTEGQMDRVTEIVNELRAQNITMSEELSELALRAERTANADPRVIGALIPLTGRARAIGQRLLHGLMLASGTPNDGPTDDDQAQLIVRDYASEPTRAAQAVEDLVSVHRAIAIIGPIDFRSAQAARDRATELGVPIITLVPEPTIVDDSRFTFRLFPGPLEEARALVSGAIARGARRFAVLHPDSRYGVAMTQAFQRAVESTDTQLVASIRYESNATAFGSVIESLAEQEFDALFIPDTARRLILIAPALAAAGLWSVTPETVPSQGRGFTLLAPSVAMDVRRLQSVNRYVQGALFANSFDASRETGPTSEYIRAYRAQFDEPPEAFGAHAFDAFSLVRRAVLAGADSRESVSAWLRSGPARPTVSASQGFGPDGQPRHPVQILSWHDGQLVPTTLPPSPPALN